MPSLHTFFSILSLFLGYVISLQFFQIVTNLQKYSSGFIEKKSTYNWTHVVQMHVTQGQLQCNTVVFVPLPGTRIHGFVSCLLLFSCVTLGKLLNFSVPPFRLEWDWI